MMLIQCKTCKEVFDESDLKLKAESCSSEAWGAFLACPKCGKFMKSLPDDYSRKKFN